MSSSFYEYRRRVRFHETDAMGVVHHSNYIRFFEEARVDWINTKGLCAYHYPESDLTLAVLETSTRHLKSAFFNDELTIRLQVRREKLKIRFRCAIYSKRYEGPICYGDVVLVPLSKENKPTRLPKAFLDAVEKESWTETWPLSL